MPRIGRGRLVKGAAADTAISASRRLPIRRWRRGSFAAEQNVELGRIELSGARTTRRVTLDVTVDGVRGAALSVMSQGELHALALSLFLPRATLPERFVVIDDPVQSMDPARVDGLARALESVAKARQVTVFTHDERLPEAVRRLTINATILSVTRRPKSVVELRAASIRSRPMRTHSRSCTPPSCRKTPCGAWCLILSRRARCLVHPRGQAPQSSPASRTRISRTTSRTRARRRRLRRWRCGDKDRAAT
jgi:hypothetical protein